ncbi:malto-oligosyltrehalose trehalohydrolase [Halopseudomonas salina]|uniref:Malto-oligosyltrehalose trehalohydrolase n=1 Tax=Halopseudomonas salina TaxID=1323744 RepID=A0ABQ1P0S9_9GAMM|nr:malto-oligosyltrehalose trehalohydrolase [Halopseudomonas salina]GGC86799.1 malto-oligosyltrehalose trehalohydrolase [Halopseudomonas salina]
MTRLNYQHGAMRLADGKTRFSLWAPSADSVKLLLESGASQEMRSEADGWFRLAAQCPADCGYRYLINGQTEVPDPASRFQPDGVTGFGQVIDPLGYPWSTSDWRGRPWHETVLYELHAGLLGGYQGVEQHLPDLARLGITAIELMPLGQFPGERNWGYDGVLPFAPQSSYGTPDELRHLIDRAHELNLMVFVDVVYNHFGPDGNYLNEYAAQFFREDISTPWGASIDFRRPQVRNFFCENALMWVLDYRIDGLRLDAVHAIGERDFLIELAKRVRQATPPGRHVHLVLENENNDAALLEQHFDAQWNDDGHNVLHTLLTGEAESYYSDYASEPTQKLGRCLAEGFVYQGELNRRGEPRGQPSAQLTSSAFVLFLQNHDQTGNRAMGERLTVLADERALKAATALLLLSPMIPLLFMGEEWGCLQPFLFFTDHNPALAKAVREGRRNEFSEFSSFVDPDRREAIPDPNALDTFTRSIPDWAERSLPNHEQWRNHYRHLLDLRHTLIIPRLPARQSLGCEVLAKKAVAATWQLGDRSLLHIDLNLSPDPVPVRERNGADVIFHYGLNLCGRGHSTLPAYSVVISMEFTT